jgi:regulation of enolase protein 1 (concanavalin A-like superfamily)
MFSLTPSLSFRPRPNRSGVSRSILTVLLTGAIVLTAFARPKGGIGGPKPEGSAVQKGDTWTVTGGGADIWGPSDQFHFVNNTVSGNCSLTAKIESLGDSTSHDYAKAALMIRADESVGALHASVSVARCGAIEFIRRSTVGGNATSDKITNVVLPVWVRITRKGNDFTASYSTDGKEWTNLGRQMTVPMKASALAGMAVTSHADGTPCTAVFSGYSMKR